MGYTRKIFGSTVMFLMMCVSMLLCSCTKDSDDNYDFSGYTNGRKADITEFDGGVFHCSKFMIFDNGIEENVEVIIRKSGRYYEINYGGMFVGEYSDFDRSTVMYTPDGGMHIIFYNYREHSIEMDLYKVGENDYIGRVFILR